MIPPRLLIAACALGALVAHAGAISAQDGPPPPGGAVGIGVMTFNIRTSAIEDGPDSWEFRKEIVAETIRRSSPQLVGMQEALAEQIAFLERELPEYRWVGVDRGLNGGTGLSEATPIFYRADQLLPIESGTFWLGTPPPNGQYRGRGGGRGGSRIVTWAQFHHVDTGQRLYVYNTHLSPRAGEQHLEAAAQINQRIAALPPGSAVLVLGDFNAAAGWSETWHAATSAGLRDAWDIAAQRSGPAETFGGFREPEDQGMGRIDWILVGGPVDVARVETVLYNRGGRYPSDHYAVFAAVSVRPS